MSFHTQVEMPDTGLIPAVGEGTGSDENLLWPLRKGPDKPFPDRVSLGRAPNCDIVVRDSSVSKLHAHFRDIKHDSAVLTDAKSANGTIVDGIRLEPGAAVTVSEFGAIVFGRVRVILLSPAAVYDWLGERR